MQIILANNNFVHQTTKSKPDQILLQLFCLIFKISFAFEWKNMFAMWSSLDVLCATHSSRLSSFPIRVHICVYQTWQYKEIQINIQILLTFENIFWILPSLVYYLRKKRGDYWEDLPNALISYSPSPILYDQYLNSPNFSKCRTRLL